MELTVGPDTEPEHVGYAGRIIGVPPGTDVGSGPTAPGNILGVYGYPVPAEPGALIPLDWVMTSVLPQVARDYIHNVPDTGWVVPAAETVYQDMSRALLERGIAMPDVGSLITALWTAAVANERAVVAAQA